MRKSESERIVRSLCHDWLRAQPMDEQEHPRFSNFRAWLDEQNPQVLRFRSTTDALEDAERWFDDELGQNWRR